MIEAARRLVRGFFVLCGDAVRGNYEKFRFWSGEEPKKA